MTITAVDRCRKWMQTAALALGLGGLVAMAAPAEAAEPIRIGSFLSVTGGASFLGSPEQKTLELYVEKVNSEGGVLGRPLELTVYDTATDPTKAATFVKRLIDQDKVDLILGGSTTGNTMAVIGLVQKAKIPFISFAGASIIVEPVKSWVFKTPHTDRVSVARVYLDLQNRDLTHLGVIAGNGGFDKSCVKNAESLAPEMGIEIVATETFGKDDTDMTPQLSRIKNAEGLEAVLFCGFGASAAIVTRNFAALDLGVPLYHTHGSASMKFVEAAGEAAEGVRLPAAALLVADQLPEDHPQKSVALAYTQAYKERYGEEISTFGGHAYDGLFLALEAIKRAGSTDKEAVRAEIEKTKDFIGVDGIFNMSPRDHLGLDDRSFVMVEVRNGAWVLLD